MAASKTKVERIASAEQYRVVNEQREVMDFTIDESSGLVSASGCYGTFSHYWTAPGPRGLREFLGDIQFGYALGKLTGRGEGAGGYRFDLKKSIASLKKIIRESNERPPEFDETKEELRDLWAENATTEEEFHRQVGECGSICHWLGSDWYLQVPCEHSRDGGAVVFWNDFFIPWVKAIQLPGAPRPQNKRVPEPWKKRRTVKP